MIPCDDGHDWLDRPRGDARKPRAAEARAPGVRRGAQVVIGA